VLRTDRQTDRHVAVAKTALLCVARVKSVKFSNFDDLNKVV